VAAALGIADEAEEGVLAVALLHASPAAAEAAGAPTRANVAPARAMPPAAWQPSALPRGAALGVTATVHRATSLRPVAMSVPAVPRSGALLLPHAPPRALPSGPVVALPLPRPGAGDPLALIAARRSRRRYTREALPMQDLSDLLAAASEAPVLSAALRLALFTPAVQGQPAHAWHLDRPGHALHAVGGPRGDVPALRQRMRSAGLGQYVVGDAAVLLVVVADRELVTRDPHGAARGYRHAFIEAGLVGERLYLAAGAQGLGVCAVGAFYDDETAGLAGFDPEHERVIHLACIGLPA
jgi:nitroreductase